MPAAPPPSPVEQWQSKLIKELEDDVSVKGNEVAAASIASTASRTLASLFHKGSTPTTRSIHHETRIAAMSPTKGTFFNYVDMTR